MAAGAGHPGVFLYHAVHPFDLTDWHIKNAEQSLPLTAVLLFVSPWGMPFFFLIAGTGTWFAMQRRTAGQYLRERTLRLLIPFFAGCLLLTPLMLTLEWMHKTWTGELTGTLADFIAARPFVLGPQMFGWAGYHLWFLGFLFSFSLLGVPLFQWLKGAAGYSLRSRLIALVERRGGFLFALIPLIAVQVLFRIFFLEGEHNWADFAYMFLYFTAGYLLYTDQRFLEAIARDSGWVLATALLTSAFLLIVAATGDVFAWIEMPQTPQFYLAWSIYVINGWSWTLLLLLIGRRSLNFTNPWLQYGQQAIVPFFMLHQPVIMTIAFFVVQWDAPILPKALLVLAGSFAATLALYEFVIRRIRPLRMLFGMKT
ncbi:MAG: acyltransferase family protein [Chloroflexi bacterium]|nr:acyltransferase family protein [Chloroflexota bacterium]